LFVYGSLRDPRIFKSVCGLSFSPRSMYKKHGPLHAELALLAEHKKVSPDNVYFYAIPDPSARIEGYLIYDVPVSAMAEVDKYEGKRYTRENVTVHTANGAVEAQAYLVCAESMRKYFGDRFHVNLIHELWLRKRIEKFIKKRTRPGEHTPDATFERRAERELLATTERDIVISHYRADAVSDYFLEHELDRPRLSIRHLFDEEYARTFFDNYISLVVKQVMLNQFDEKIQARYRYELDRIRTSERYFKRSVSLLVVLRMLNAISGTENLIINQCLETMPQGKYDLIDYVKYAINAADEAFDDRVARSELEKIRSNLQPGLVPLGAELEFSNLGFRTVRHADAAGVTDRVFDGFKYFHDFGLDILFWKLGGYIDDHSGVTDRARRQGFLEFSPGRLNIEGELSRPATADPWLMNQLIHEITAFYPIRPHSLHLSFQLRRRQIGKQGILPLGFAKSLLLLAGGLQQKNDGRLWVSRMGYDEITDHRYGEELVFARTSKRKWHLGDPEIASRTPVQAVTQVQQYKFIRLDRRANYEPLILALKGIQLACNPGDYLTAAQLHANPELRRQYGRLKAWATQPTAISPQTMTRFLDTVQQGLMCEGAHTHVHKLHYIDWALSSIDVQLRLFNKQIRKQSQQV